MAYCPKCGSKLNEKDNFCQSCGLKVKCEKQVRPEKLVIMIAKNNKDLMFGSFGLIGGIFNILLLLSRIMIIGFPLSIICFFLSIYGLSLRKSAVAIISLVVNSIGIVLWIIVLMAYNVK